MIFSTTAKYLGSRDASVEKPSHLHGGNDETLAELNVTF